MPSFKSSHRRCFIKKVVLKIFSIFAGTHILKNVCKQLFLYVRILKKNFFWKMKKWQIKKSVKSKISGKLFWVFKRQDQKRWRKIHEVLDYKIQFGNSVINTLSSVFSFLFSLAHVNRKQKQWNTKVIYTYLLSNRKVSNQVNTVFYHGAPCL